MKYQKLAYLLLILSFINITLGKIHTEKLIEFSTDEQRMLIKGYSSYRIPATFTKENPENYLYIHTQNYEDKKDRMNTTFRFYFKKYEESEETINYLKSDYSTIDYNSGLFIKIGDLNYEKANIFIIGYETFCFVFIYQIVNKISFPPFYEYSNFQLNQFILPKNEYVSINFERRFSAKEYLMIFSKTSLRKIDIKVTYDNVDVTEKNGDFIFPNGYSFIFDKSVLNKLGVSLKFKITNKNNKNEIIVLGYVQFNSKTLFPNSIYNGFQLYLEGNSFSYEFLENWVISGNYQYFTYQSYAKNAKITFVQENGADDDHCFLKDYNSMVNLEKMPCTDKIRFDFDNFPKTSLYFQYLNFTQNQLTQKILHPLVSGSPKSILLPAKKSLYHFLPKDYNSETINYYLKSNDQETKFVWFLSCTNYPDDCSFDGKQDENSISPFISNIGLWYSLPTNKDELQIIYIYCENQCSYDILMTYDDDPLFLFPGNNYTKFIGEEGKDSFLLPVFEDLSNNEAIKIDLTILSGNGSPKLTLYSGIGGTVISSKPEIYERKISYNIPKNTFTEKEYYNKEIYAVLEGDKNIFYHIIYAGVSSQQKFVDNNRVIIETLTVPNLGEESGYTKVFTFKNFDPQFYISISTKSCESKVVINDGTSAQGYTHNFELNSIGNINVKIYLINDNGICNGGFKETVTLFSYSSKNTNILIGENNLINTTLKTKEITFTHLFKPAEGSNADNSYNIEIEKLSKSTLSFSYTIEKVSFNTTKIDSTNLPFSMEKIITEKKNNIINSAQINEYCGNIMNNEICRLIIKLSSLDESQFSLFLNKNGRNYARHLTNKTLLNSINSKSIQYFYIDLNKEYNTDILIDSNEQDLEISTLLYSSDSILNEEKNLPSSFHSIPNHHQFTQPKNNKCGKLCQLYIAIKVPEDPYKKEFFSTFSISYVIKEEESEESPLIYLPMNYFLQYSFINSDFSKINYYFKNYEPTNLKLELYLVKQNDDDNSIVTASIKGREETLNSLTESLLINNFEGELLITVTFSGDYNPIYKIKISKIGEYSINPINTFLSSYSEKCKSELCFYSLDIENNNDIDYAYFFIPETENAIISIKKFNYDEKIDNSYLTKDAAYDENSNKGNQRSNWLEYKINNKNVILLIRLYSPEKAEVSLLASFNSKPNLVTLNYAEKRIFTIQNQFLDNITFNITKPKSSNIKYRINLHAIKGNGIISLKDENYYIGLDSCYKENISLIVDENSLNNLLMKVNNKKDEKVEKIFSFTIDYRMTSSEQFFYEIMENKINSFKFIGNKDFQNLTFYMKANKLNKTHYNDITMNIKIYTNSSKYDIIAYIVDSNFIENIKNNNSSEIINSPIGTNKIFIDGGSSNNGTLYFSKLEISSKEFEPYINDGDQMLYIYIVFIQRGTNNKVRIDLYPYEIPYINKLNPPLSRNELFIQKLPANTENYPLLLSKSDAGSTLNIKVEFIFPLSDKYDLAIINYDKNKDSLNPYENGTDVIFPDQNENENGKYKIIINTNSNNNLLNILFNIRAKGQKELKDDSFIFKYGYENQEIYKENEDFYVEGSAKNVTFHVEAVKPKYKTGETILIFNAYKASDIPDKIPGEEYLSIYLLFSKIKPIFTMYQTLYYSSKSTQYFTTTSITKEGKYIFTCVAVVQDNERVDYLGYKAVKVELDKSDLLNDLLDYMKNHVLASTIIGILILFFIGIMVNICRVERRGSGKESSKNVELILEDKNIN